MPSLPDDYDPRALATPIDETPEEQRRFISPPLNRRSDSLPARNNFRQNRPPTWQTQMRNRAGSLQEKYMKFYNKLSVLQRSLLAFAGLTSIVFGILFLVYHKQIIDDVLIPMAKKWRNIPAGWLIVWFGIFVVSFPPLIGYSSLLTIAGFVYGFPNSWFICATATTVGSTCSFIASRYLFSSYIHRLLAHDRRFSALALTLKHDGIKLLIMIRLCPLPYSLSNGAVSTIPTVHWTTFAIATAIASLKLMLHLFVGAQLAKLAEEGEEMDTGTKVMSYMSIVIGVVAGILTGVLIYRKTKKRAAELEALEAQGARRASVEDLEREYADDPDALRAAEQLHRDDDEISLATQEGEEFSPYRDSSSSSSEENLAGDEDVEDVFKAGDGDEEEGRAGGPRSSAVI